MSSLRVQLFGRLQVETDKGAIRGFEARKVQELFVYLILHRNRQHSREALADLLWGNSPTAQTKKSLRQTLWQMQSALTAGGVDPCLLLIEAEWIGINPEINLWLDVAEFEVAAGLLGKSLAKQFAPTTLQKIEAALQVYRGNLLEGWYNDWCLFERERLQDLYLTMLSRLLDDAELRGDYEKGILYGEKILSYDNAHERTHQRLMRLRYLTGDRTAALRQFERCAVALQRDLDVKPSQETLDMCTWLRSDGGKGLVSANPPPAASPELLTLFHMMHQVHNLMDELQSQIQRYLTGEIATAHSLDVSPIYDGEPDV